ncbi:MAG: sodium:solute symporter family protein [candidate division KSB1 bacterium]|nr:sodium:solute symporter family protein [candidate division KSB1 bacterium]MDZ7401106.1 sodium:solute symporter family protein [candidate division KSB1 bacterium]
MTTFFGISLLDLIVLASYFILITYLGVWTHKKIKSSGDFFMGNRRFGKIMMIAQAFGVGTHTDQPVSVAGASYTTGLAGIWYQWVWMFSTPFYWIVAPIYRRLRYVTMADFFQERYGNTLAVLYTIIGVTYFCMDIGIMLKGTGITVEGLTGGVMSESTIILIATALFVIYGLAGGLIAAVVTDLIQGFLILVLSFMLIPFAIHKAGGLSAIHQGLPEHMFSLVAPHEVTLFFIIAIVINGLIGIVVQPHHMAVGGSGKTEIACRTGWTYGNFLKRFATMGWAFVGVFAAFLFPGLGFHERELAFGIAAKNLLPVGLVGLMVAALIAAVMSTCDSFMVHASALFTRNIYLKYINPQASDRALLKTARLSSGVIVLGGLLFAYIFPSVVHGLMEVWKVTAYLGIAFWAGVIWKKANRYGALASALSMAAIAIYTGNYLKWPLQYQIALYVPVGIVVMIVVSHFTRSEPEEQLHNFYTLLDTPVGKEQRLKDQHIEIMLEGESQVPPPKKIKEKLVEKFLARSDVEDGLLVVDLLSLPKKFSWARYRVDIIGFLVACVIVALLIGLAMVLARVGA